MASEIKAALPATCTIQTPDHSAKPQEIIPSRWSDVLLSNPYAAVTPTSISDIISTIEYARAHKLKLIPSGGGRSSFVPITKDVIYLDLKHFDTFKLDEENREVKIGGGCISGPLIKGLAKQGYYTAVPNSNGVGMTGALLGGLNHPFIGFHGMGVDMIKSITVIPFSSPAGGAIEPLTLTKDSTGEQKKLFDTLKGAGHGLGIITEVILDAYPIANLSLDDTDKVWQRTLVFPPPALSTAIETYLTLKRDVPKEMNYFLGFMRAPPNAPRPGAPVIILSISYFGLAAAAERAAAVTFDAQVLEKSVNASTSLTPLGDLNNILDPVNKAGGFKELHGAFVRDISESSLSRAFESFIAYTDGKPERFGSSIIFPVANTVKSESFAGEGSFYNARDRGVYVQVKTSYPSAEGKEDGDAFARDVHGLGREADQKEGRREWTFANNMVKGTNLEDVYTKEQLEDIVRVNNLWNASKVGWSPVVDKWSW